MCVICDLRRISTNRDNSEAKRLGGAALVAYLTGHWNATAAIVDVVRGKSDWDGLYEMCAVWCDSILPTFFGYERGAPVYLLWQEVCTGRMKHSDEVPPTIRWAGQLLAARAANDEDGSRALFGAVSPDALEEHLGALLDVLAHQVRTQNADGVA